MLTVSMATAGVSLCKTRTRLGPFVHQSVQSKREKAGSEVQRVSASRTCQKVWRGNTNSVTKSPWRLFYCCCYFRTVSVWPRPPHRPREGWAGCQNKQACGVSRAAESPLQHDVTSGCDITGRGRRLFVLSCCRASVYSSAGPPSVVWQTPR